MSAKLQKGVTDLSAVEKLAGRTRQCVQPGPGTFAPLAGSEVSVPLRMLSSVDDATAADGRLLGVWGQGLATAAVLRVRGHKTGGRPLSRLTAASELCGTIT